MSTGRRVLAAAGLGLAVTGFVALTPFARFAYRGPDVHLVLETSEGLIGVAVAYLVFGRLRARGRRSDLALLSGLAASAAANLLLSVLPALVSAAEGRAVETWAPIPMRLLSAGLLAVSPLLGERRLAAPVRAGRLAMAAILGLCAAAVAVTAGLAHRLPPAVDLALTPAASVRPLLVGHPIALTLQAVILAGFLVACVGFWRQAERERDPFLGWVAAAAALGVAARLNYLLFPSLYTDWVYVGDLLRLGFWLLLLYAAAGEIGRYWRRLAAAAVADERRRIARDLHDGLAQELAYIVAQAPALRAEGGPGLDRVAGAAERALDESRRAISLLAGTGDEPLDRLLVQTAEDVAGRVGVRVVPELDTVVVSPQEREALVRIVREAVTNAARHGGASVVALRLESRPRRLIVRDDGRGFDPEAVTGGGFGLRSMRERAEALGARYALRSAPGRGTEVEVVLP